MPSSHSHGEMAVVSTQPQGKEKDVLGVYLSPPWEILWSLRLNSSTPGLVLLIRVIAVLSEAPNLESVSDCC